jgi:hypothetical protein
MSRRMQENLFALIMLALFVAIFVVSLGYGPRARLVPLPIAALGIIVMMAQIVWQNVRSTDDLKINVQELVGGSKASKLAGAAASVTPGPAPQAVIVRTLTAFGIVIALLALFMTVGPLPAVFIFSLGYFVLSGHCSPLRAFLYALACAAILYLMFGYVLRMQLNRGLAAPFIEQYVYF